MQFPWRSYLAAAHLRALPMPILRKGSPATFRQDHPKSGKRCALIANEAPQPMPDPARPYAAELGGGVSCLVPLALYSAPSGTLPRGASPAQKAKVAASGNDRATRLAAVALGWNIFQHFYPYFDVVSADWPSALRRALTSAATDPDEVAFLGTLRRLVAQLQDVHGRVFLGAAQASFLPPFLWDWVENRLVITYVDPDASLNLKAGDIALDVDGKA